MKFIRPQKPHFFKPILAGFKNGIRIPATFSQHILGTGETYPEEALLKKNGKEWRVNVINEHFTGAGWRRFAENNDVKSGDFIVFEHQGNMVFNAMIFDAITQCGSKPQISTKAEFEVKKKVFSDLEEEEEVPDISNLNLHNSFISTVKAIGNGDESPVAEITPHIANRRMEVNVSLSENDEYPYFTSKIMEYSITKQCLCIPMKFARSNGFNGKQEMILMNKSGRTWRVKLRPDYCHFCITVGWKDFCVGNGIRQGDAFKFELVENGEVPVVRFTVMNPGSVGTS